MKNRRTDIERYLRGELSPAEMHALEKEALNDPFLAEALEGLEQTGADNFLFDLHALSRSVHDRTRSRKSRTIRMWGWTGAVAATLLLVAISGFLAVTIVRDQHAREQAMKSAVGPGEEHSKPSDQSQPTADTLAQPLESATPSTAQRAATPEQEHSGGRADDELSRKAPHDPGKTDAEIESTPPDLLADNEIPEKEEENKSTVDAPRQVPDVAGDGIALSEEPDIEAEKKETATQSANEKAAKRQVQPAGETRAKSADAPQALAATAVRLSGKVVSAEDGEGLPGVTVTVKGTTIGSVTDAYGNYTLTPPSVNSKLLFSFVGYETEEVDVSGRNEINVKLEAAADQLSEVVVTGYGSTSSRTVEEAASFQTAEPQGGKASLRRYLLESMSYPQEALNNKVQGKVTVRFTVQPDGALTDFEVMKGIGSGCDEELIRLLKEGPSWKPAKQGDTPVPDKVKVRLRFELP